MNILLGRDSQPVLISFLFSMFLGGSLFGAACASSDDELGTPAKNPIVSFYASKLSEYPLKFVEAACLAVTQDPAKGPDFLQKQYQEDQKGPKASVLVRTLRKQCNRLMATYRTHKFWKHYEREIVEQAMKNFFYQTPGVRADELLTHYADDAKTLDRGYESFCKDLAQAPTYPVSKFAIVMFLNCEVISYCKAFDFVVNANKELMELKNDKDDPLLPFVKRVSNALQLKSGEPVNEQFVRAAVLICRQEKGISEHTMCSWEHVEKASMVYKWLDSMFGEKWRMSSDFANFAKPLVARIAKSSCFSDVTLVQGTYGAWAVCSALNLFFKNLYTKHNLQRKWDDLRVAMDADFDKHAREMRAIVDVEMGIAKLYADRVQHLHNVEHGMQSEMDWAKASRELELQFFREKDNLADRLMQEGVAQYAQRFAMAQQVACKNIESSNLVLQRRYFASMAAFACKQKQERDQLAVLAGLRQSANLAEQRQTMNRWYGYARLRPWVKALVAEENVARQDLGKKFEQRKFQVRLSPLVIARFSQGLAGVARSHDPYGYTLATVERSGSQSVQQ